MRLVTSQVSLINSLTKHGWRLVYYGHQTKQAGGLECLKKANSNRRITASFDIPGGRCDQEETRWRTEKTGPEIPL